MEFGGERVIFMTVAAVRGVLLGPCACVRRGYRWLSLVMRSAGPWHRSAVEEAIEGSRESDKVRVPGYRATARA